jgi:hypothetical protein
MFPFPYLFPIEIVNKIMIYVAEINNSMMITQFNTNREYYKINFHSDLLWKVKANMMMKRIYPIYHFFKPGDLEKEGIEIYKFGMIHYENKLRTENKRIQNKI